MTKVTVLMSVYNEEQYLQEAINSILKQTFEDYEFLIINDGSTDKTSEILKTYNDSRIKIIKNEKNIGLTKSLNKGLQLASGKYIARMDADDIAYPRRIEMQYECMKNDPDSAMCSCFHEEIDYNGNMLRKVENILTSEELYYSLTFYNRFPHSSAFFKKNDVLDLGGYDEKLKWAQDFELWYRVSRKRRIIQVEEILLKLRIHSKSISLKFGDNQKNIATSIALKNIEKIYKGYNGQMNSAAMRMLCEECFNKVSFNTLDLKTFIKSLIALNHYLIESAPDYINRERLKRICWDNIYYYMLFPLRRKSIVLKNKNAT